MLHVNKRLMHADSFTAISSFPSASASMLAGALHENTGDFEALGC
jgi:hypothetical protein